MQILYRQYCITSGIGFSHVSEINAFDTALMAAKISEVNLVPVSSILPIGSVELERVPSIDVGEVVHCVMARQYGVLGERVAAGLAVVTGSAGGKCYGLVMEAHALGVTDVELRSELADRVKAMCDLRGFAIDSTKYVVESCVVSKKFGCALVALLYR